MDISDRQALALKWIFDVLSAIAIVARLILRTLQRQWSLWVSDIFLVLAWLSLAALVIGDTYQFRHDEDEETEFYNEALVKWRFATCFLFDGGLYLPRFSLLAFYYELFPISESMLRKSLYGVMVYSVCCFITVILLDLLWCGTDTSRNWSEHAVEEFTISSLVLIEIIWTFGISTELLVLLLPLPLINRLRMLQTAERKGLSCILLLGLITVSISIGRFALNTQSIFFNRQL
ncbi:hypothetical protein BX600DRAFT_99993 [Xylariales sp. PMI_506]|nr:hypothetical protein BX600DRAFT_99993 [Xylariales sp. PMI_506]